MGKGIVAATDATFASVVKKGFVLVDFYADWCGPCRTMKPVLEGLAEEMDGRLRIAKLDVDANPRSTGDYAIESIPTLMLFKDGQPLKALVGAVPKREVKAWVEALLGRARESKT